MILSLFVAIIELHATNEKMFNGFFVHILKVELIYNKGIFHL
jgi:hypothetical protein